MLSWRLLLQTGEPQYADLIERTLLNGILVSPREDGRAFYYANTLHQRTAGEAETADGELSERAEATLARAVVRGFVLPDECLPHAGEPSRLRGHIG